MVRPNAERSIERATATYLATAATWSLLGQIVGVTDPMGNRWSYDYDSLGRRIAASDPDLGEWTYAYDAAGRVTLRTDALGQGRVPRCGLEWSKGSAGTPDVIYWETRV